MEYEQVYFGTQKDIFPVIDGVAGGDAVSAGLIYGIMYYNDDYQKVLDFSVAALLMSIGKIRISPKY